MQTREGNNLTNVKKRCPTCSAEVYPELNSKSHNCHRCGYDMIISKTLTDKPSRGLAHGIRTNRSFRKNVFKSSYHGFLVRCPKCGSKDTFFDGYKYNKRGTEKKYQCSKCGKNFSDNMFIIKMKHSGYQIKNAVELYYMLNSCALTSEILTYFDINIHKSTVARWVKKYSSDFEDGTGLWNGETFLKSYFSEVSL
jgi:DNA-directed RNA polymerase subunit RPC12/RpoP